MRRADRLFQIVQLLRSRRLTKAQWLAETLEVSTRTIYRDIADLIGNGVPIEGEAGVGYVLRHKLDLPPLMFTRDELTALELGLRFVKAYSDKTLMRAALSAAAKIKNCLPELSPAQSAHPVLFVPERAQTQNVYFAQVFAAIEQKQKLQLHYRDAKQKISNRTVWPLGCFFFGDTWILLAWCEQRQDFRNFRFDRIHELINTNEHYTPTPGRTLQDYFAWLQKQYHYDADEFVPLQKS